LFFSSRRRHTSLQGDWSSDVCSSDLQKGEVPHEEIPPVRVAGRSCAGARGACRRVRLEEVELLEYHHFELVRLRVRRRRLGLVRSEERRVGKDGGARRGAVAEDIQAR